MNQGQAMNAGTIIYLNGPSSAGKTRLAHALQRILDEPYFHLSTDDFAACVLRRADGGEAFAGAVIGPKLNRGFVRCIVALASSGLNVLVDDVLCESWRLDGNVDDESGADLLNQRLEALAPYSVLYVGIYCSLEELEQREHTRGDRSIGLARFQYHRVHAHSIYDVEVDTSLHTLEECAAQVKVALTHRRFPSAFERMRQPAPTG
jgi:chloramphenicol 3-O phosphotransferase